MPLRTISSSVIVNTFKISKGTTLKIIKKSNNILHYIILLKTFLKTDQFRFLYRT